MDNKVNQLYDALQWYEGLKETTNESYMPLYLDQKRYLVLRGGAGSGKSVFAGRKVLERCINEPGHRWLVLRQVKDTLQMSCYEQLLAQLEKYYPHVKYDSTLKPMRITFANKSVILFAGADGDKIKSIYDTTGIWIEEANELTEDDFNIVDDRLRVENGRYLQIILTFNPVSILHWLKRRFFDTTDPEVLAEITTHHSNYLSNRFVGEKYGKQQEAYKLTDPYHYMVYCLGEWGVTGKTVFNGEKVTERILKKIQPLKTGYYEYSLNGDKLSDITWKEDKENGYIKIYEESKEGYPYVIGGDTAGDGSDFFTGQVLNNVTGNQAATFRRQIEEGEYARQMYCLGMDFNEALIGIETNFSTHPIKKLIEYNYPNQYVRGERPDKFTGTMLKQFGFFTGTLRKPAIEELVEFAENNIDCINDTNTLEEMLTFVRDESFRAQAENGAHDDCIMALAIAHYIRPQQQMIVQTTAQKGRKWSKDMLEDYHNANPEGQAYLERKWGIPTYG